MKFIATEIEDLFILEPRVFEDERGYFMESFSAKTFEEQGLDYNWIQDNEAKSSRGVLRGMHYQIGELAQAKLVRVVEGEVLDVVVDIRPDSKTYGQSYSVRLSGENKRQFLVPRGFAHGYICLSETAVFAYKCDSFYSREHEFGLSFDSVDVDWILPFGELIISEKDKVQPPFGEHQKYV